MKNILIPNLLLLILTSNIKAQSHYEIIVDTVHNNEEILRGEILKSDLENNPAYTWYRESQLAYPVPLPAAVAGMKKNRTNVNVVIFGGSWCKDSRFILPKFFKIQEVSDFPEDRIVIYSVDRAKHMPGTIVEDYHVISIPTIIVMKDGREVGRLVEYGKSGQWDKEFADIFSE